MIWGFAFLGFWLVIVLLGVGSYLYVLGFGLLYCVASFVVLCGVGFLICWLYAVLLYCIYRFDSLHLVLRVLLV